MSNPSQPTLRPSGIPFYLAPRVWKVLHSSGDKQMVITSGGLYAVGRKLRTGAELDLNKVSTYTCPKKAHDAYMTLQVPA